MQSNTSPALLYNQSSPTLAQPGEWSVRSWIHTIDPLRGIAAVAVVVQHASQAWRVADSTSPFRATLFWLGAWGVTLFFVLSGFCIHLPNARKLENNPEHEIDWRQFAYRRARRLLPTHYAALILSAFLALFIQTELLTRPTAGSFLAHLFMVHVWYAPYFYSINAVFWSIAVECHFYACYPVYLVLRKRFGAGLTTFILLPLGLTIFFVASIALQGGSKLALQNLFLVSWWQWTLGATLADIYVAGKSLKWTWVLTSRWSVPFWCLSSLSLGLADITVAHLHVNRWMLPVFCGGLLGSLALREGSTKASPTLSYLGKFSYSIYLIHPIAFGLLFMLPGFRSVPAWAGVPLAVIAAIAASWLFYLLIERHFLSPSARRQSEAIGQSGT